jgi:hypothetical protein
MNFESIPKPETYILAQQLIENLKKGNKLDDETRRELIKILEITPEVAVQAEKSEENQSDSAEHALQHMAAFMQSGQGRPLFRDVGIDANNSRASSAVMDRIAEMITNHASIVEISRGIDFLNEFSPNVGGSAFGLRSDTSLNRNLRPLMLRFLADFVPRSERDLIEYSRLWSRVLELTKERRSLLFKFEKGDLTALQEAREIIRNA